MKTETTNCKYYKPRMATLLEYCKCLYQLEGCVCGGSLHILLDDNNYRDSDILFCLNECIKHPEREESDLGILICKEYLKLSKEERDLFDSMWNGRESVDCLGYDNCKGCPIMEEDEETDTVVDKPQNMEIPRRSGRYPWGEDFEAICIECKDLIESDHIIKAMDEILRMYDFVSVADLYDLIGESSSYSSNNYGWANLDGVVRERDPMTLKVIIKFPRAIPIK